MYSVVNVVGEETDKQKSNLSTGKFTFQTESYSRQSNRASGTADMLLAKSEIFLLRSRLHYTIAL